MDLAKLESSLDGKLRSRNQAISEVFEKNNKIEVANEGYDKNPQHFFIKKAHRCFVEDYSGNSYIDTSLGAGTHIFGHGFINEAIAAQLQNGTLFTIPSVYPYEVASIINKMVGHLTHFVFCNSGSEATMRAARIARGHSKKRKIAMFSGCWHGTSDVLMFDDDVTTPQAHPQATFKSGGMPMEFLDTIVMLPYNSPAAFDIIKASAGDLAMVIIEPSQGSNPRADMLAFLTELRAVTKRHNVLLCFDEVITGFRIMPGGCQEYYNIEADIVTYGKTVGGGLPIGVVAGNAEVMAAIKGNEPDQKPVFMGGTFSANPLVMYAARAVLTRLSEHKETVYPELNENGQRLRNTVNQSCIENDLPVRMMGIGSMSRIFFTDKVVGARRDRDSLELDTYVQNVFFKYLLLEHGVFVNKNRIMFLSTTHDREIVNTLVNAVMESLEFFRASAYL